MSLSVNRLDLFGDFQNWNLSGSSRHEFVCRAQSRHTYEDNGVFNGFIFGTRKSDTVLARIYDKTMNSSMCGSSFGYIISVHVQYDEPNGVLRTHSSADVRTCQ